MSSSIATPIPFRARFPAGLVGPQGAQGPAGVGVIVPVDMRPLLSDLTGASDQTSVMQAAATAATLGAVQEYPLGHVKFATSAPVTLRAGQRVKGQNGGLATGGGTWFEMDAASGTGIVVTGYGGGVEDVLFTSPTTPSTATAVQLGNGEQPRQQSIKDCAFEGYGTAISVHDGTFWSLNNVAIDGAQVYGLRIRNTVHIDYGDPAITEALFSSCATAIRYESGGGLKMAAVKILGGNIGIDVAISPEPGALGSGTSDLFLSGVSIEGTATAAMQIGVGGTMDFYSTTIVAQIGVTMGDGIIVGPHAQTVNIAPSTIIGHGGTGVAVRVTGGNNILVAPQVTTAGGPATVLISGGTNVSVDTRRMVPSSTTGLVVQDTRPITANVGSAPSDLKYSVGNIVLTTSWKTIFVAQLVSFGSAELSVFLQGLVNGAGAGAVSSRFLLVSQGASAAPTTIYSYASGVAIDLQLDCSAIDGTVNVQARLHTGTGSSIIGCTLDVAVTGRVAKFGPGLGT